MEKFGSQDLAVRVGPLAGDVRPDNDRRAFAIQVADDKARVLLVDAERDGSFSISITHSSATLASLSSPSSFGSLGSAPVP